MPEISFDLHRIAVHIACDVCAMQIQSYSCIRTKMVQDPPFFFLVCIGIGWHRCSDLCDPICTFRNAFWVFADVSVNRQRVRCDAGTRTKIALIPASHQCTPRLKAQWILFSAVSFHMGFLIGSACWFCFRTFGSQWAGRYKHTCVRLLLITSESVQVRIRKKLKRLASFCCFYRPSRDRPGGSKWLQARFYFFSTAAHRSNMGLLRSRCKMPKKKKKKWNRHWCQRIPPPILFIHQVICSFRSFFFFFSLLKVFNCSWVFCWKQ